MPVFINLFITSNDLVQDASASSCQPGLYFFWKLTDYNSYDIYFSLGIKKYADIIYFLHCVHAGIYGN